MNIPGFEQTQFADISTFISFWSRLYAFNSPEKNYLTVLKKKRFTLSDTSEKDDLHILFKWKNGMKLSQKKYDAVETFKKEIINLNKMKGNVDSGEFSKLFKMNKAVVWKIFLLHSLQPEKYPVYDQHVHRAHLFIESKQFCKMSWDDYLKNYIPFIDKIKVKVIEWRKIDKALWTFGKFLSTPYAKALNQSYELL